MHDRKHDIQLIATEHQFINLWIGKCPAIPLITSNTIDGIAGLCGESSKCVIFFHLIGVMKSKLIGITTVLTATGQIWKLLTI